MTAGNRAMTTPPAEFDGILDGLYAQYVEPNLPRPETVALCHNLLADYCQQSDPLLLIRQILGMKAGTDKTTKAGFRIRATDNAPAWWMHYVTFQGHFLSAAEFPTVIENAPVRMFDVGKHVPRSISKAGWYVAHIFRVKNGDTRYEEWDRPELTRRFLRSIHPCNHFYVPKTKPQKYGEDPRVIAYFARRYANRYASVWSDFLRQIGETDFRTPEDLGQFPITIATKTKSASPVSSRVLQPPTVTYTYGRVCFLSRHIEPLAESQEFRMITPNGTYQMSKAEFYHHFPQIVSSKSYCCDKLYHRATPMPEILPYRVSEIDA